jgi:hypothetical protein
MSGKVKPEIKFVTYQSWNWAGGRPSLGCIVTYKMPRVVLWDAMVGDVLLAMFLEG